MKNVLCFGEALIDFLHIGATSQGPLSLPEFRQYPGGAPANAAVAVAQLGGQARFAGQVGADKFGDFLSSALEQYGVDTRFLLRHPSAKTSLAFVMLDDSGDRSFSFYRHETADVMLTPAQISPDWFNPDGLVHICSNTLTTPAIAQSTTALIAQAKAAGQFISFDVNLRHNLWAAGAADRDVVNALVKQADLVKFSRDELEYLAQGQSEAYLQDCLHAGCALLLVTDGANRIDFYGQHHSGSIQPPKVKAVDTTAGGDAFIGGVLFGLSVLNSQQAVFSDAALLKQLLTFASFCGAYAVTLPGAFPALPDQQAVAQLMQQHQLSPTDFDPAFFRSL
ncbi:carbohydrate kinase [Rheinheimera sp.]|uniref:carbohydrate kinase family protein n=1 Tax=Rheinheimera sp. TaxID=1869214 RepID=UPI00307E8BF3